MPPQAPIDHKCRADVQLLTQYVRNMRRERGMSQERLAREVGVCRVQLTKWEAHGLQGIRLSNFLKLLQVLSVEIALTDARRSGVEKPKRQKVERL